MYNTAGSHIFLREPTPRQQEEIRHVFDDLARLHELARAEGRRLWIVIFPNKVQVENRSALSGRFYDADAPARRVMAWCEDQDVACLDLLPVLGEAYAAGGGALFFPVDRHMNPRGNRVAADAIGAFLSEAAP